MGNVSRQPCRDIAQAKACRRFKCTVTVAGMTAGTLYFAGYYTTYTAYTAAIMARCISPLHLYSVGLQLRRGGSLSPSHSLSLTSR